MYRGVKKPFSAVKGYDGHVAKSQNKMRLSNPRAVANGCSVLPNPCEIQRSENERGGNPTFKQDLSQWAHEMSIYSSIHGVIWYTRLHNRLYKLLIFACSVIIILALPAFLVYQLALFASNDTIVTAVETDRVTEAAYPNVTVCNAKFFDTRLLQEYNVSNELANYMTMALDLSLAELAMLTRQDNPSDPEFEALIVRLQAELDDVLERTNMTLLQLFHAVAVRCENFVVLCEIHRVFYTSRSFGQTSGGESCCEKFFHEAPIFTNGGTCFTTKAKVYERYPSTLSNIKMWFDLQENYAPKFETRLKGSDAIERKGAVFSISHRDTPSALININPRKAGAQTVTIVGLSMLETDNERVVSKQHKCLARNATFEALYGLEYTQKNCELMTMHYAIRNCSMAYFYGLKKVPGLDLCTPQELLGGSTLANDTEEQRTVFNYLSCPSDCHKVEYDFSSTSSQMDLEALRDYLRLPEEVLGADLSDRNESMFLGIQFYFKTFEFNKNINYQQGFFEFLSQVGGTMGLCLGASIFSLVEIIYFMFYLLEVVTRHTFSLKA